MAMKWLFTTASLQRELVTTGSSPNLTLNLSRGSPSEILTLLVPLLGLFNIDLVDSITYASIPVHSTVNGKTRCQGYIPTIVSKCGWLLKEQATRTKGIFRVSGSAKRVAELQVIFDSPPHYGSQLDWTGYTIHDASNVLRRYLNHLPDPVITLEYYERFRDVHRNLKEDDEKITAYQELISKLPPPHSCLLMYLLDLLSLFAHHSDENLMDSKNLASVFQPGVLSHPDHSMSPGEYMASAAVLTFLIDHQSSFTLPTPNIDDDDDDVVNFGLISHPPQHQLPTQGDSKLHIGGYVTASDHERLHNTALDRGVSFEADDAVHILNTGVRRQLSLHKPIIPHSILPGNPPQRSRSTNSSVSSRRSSHSSLFSSTFLAKRRSSRASKTTSKIIIESESGLPVENVEQVKDILGFSEKSWFIEEDSQALVRKNSSIRKAVTSPLLGSDEANPEFSSYLSRRKQLKAEGLHREPSVICQEIEIQFQAPIIEAAGQAASASASYTSPIPLQPTTLPRGNKNNQNISDSLSKERPRGSLVPTAAQIHTLDFPARQHENTDSSPQLGPLFPPTRQKRTSVTRQPQPQNIDHDVTSPQRPTNSRMPIIRAKSNPGDLTSIGSRNLSQGITNSHHAGGNHAIEKFKGLFTSKHRDNDSASSKEGDGKETKKDKRRESLTDKQRKHMSQEVISSHLQGSSSGRRGVPVHGTIEEHGTGTSERAYARPPPPRPQQSGPTPPQRPRPPPPESSLMDLLDPPQRIGHISGHSTPSEGSRSASPTRSSSSTRNPLPTNASFASTSSVKSLSSNDRLYHGKSKPFHGSSSSLEFVIPNPDDSHSHSRQRSPRSGNSPQIDSFFHNQSHFDHHSQYQQQPLSSHSLPRHSNHHNQRQHPHGAYSSVSGNDNGGSSILVERHYDNLSPPQPSQFVSRSRQSSFGSNDTYDPNLPPTPTPKSRERRATGEGSSSSIRRGDVTPPRARSNSSRNHSPIHSPALKPLSRNASSQSVGSSGAGQSHSHAQQHHVPSPLAESHGANYVNSPSNRARSRTQSRDEQHFLNRQESGRERERNRSVTGLAITTIPNNMPLDTSIDSLSPRPIWPNRFASPSG
ncbi:hypothetical protein BGX27_000633 [Mortierella sp. AM989]|nr:hypothetical protein BGX27_000633 [Mortierella sp. AM989]